MRSEFEKKYDHSGSPEWRFMYLITNRETEEAVSLFNDSARHGDDEINVNTPWGVFYGKDEIRKMADTWYDTLHCIHAYAVPVTSTISGGRAVTEMVIHCRNLGGKEYNVPMAAVCDLTADNKMDALRLYMHWKALPDLPAYRAPLFKDAGDNTLRHEMLSGSVRDYFVYLHDPSRDIASFADHIYANDFRFAGYDNEGVLIHRDTDAVKFEHGIQKSVGTLVLLRIETIIDDGHLCCVEWEQVVTPAGKEAGRLSQAGCSFYERDETGRIVSARVIDYANSEPYIDWSKETVTKEEAQKIHYLG